MKNGIRFIEIQFTFGFLGTDVLHSQATTLSGRLKLWFIGSFYSLWHIPCLTPHDLDLLKQLGAPGHLIQWPFLGVACLHLPESYHEADPPILPKALKTPGSVAFPHNLCPPHTSP